MDGRWIAGTVAVTKAHLFYMGLLIAAVTVTGEGYLGRVQGFFQCLFALVVL